MILLPLALVAAVAEPQRMPASAEMKKAFDHLDWLGNLINLGFGPDGGVAFDKAYGRVKVRDEAGISTTVRRFYKNAFFSGRVLDDGYQCQQRIRVGEANTKVVCDMNFKTKKDGQKFAKTFIFHFVSGTLASIEILDGRGATVG